MRTRALWLAVPILVMVVFALAFPKTSIAQPDQRVNQGCVNQGTDHRAGGWLVCWAQRHLSWKSRHRPHFFLIGKRTDTSLGFAWPPYIVYNQPERRGRWRMFRIGFRYDRNWHGYIFPTAAWKTVAVPLEY